MTALLVLVSLYLVFFMYLMFAGAGLMRTLSVLRVAAWQSSLAGLVVGVVVALFSVAGGAQAFLTVMTFMSLVLLPTAALSRRDFVLPAQRARSGLPQRAGAGHGRARALVSFPRHIFRGWLSPAAQSLRAVDAAVTGVGAVTVAFGAGVARGRAGAARQPPLAFLFEPVGATREHPVGAARGHGHVRHFKAGSLQAYVETVFACLGLVYVVLTWMTLRDAVFARRTTMEGERSIDSTEGVGVARALADRMDAGRLHPWVLVAAGLLTYFAIWLSLMHSLDRQVAASAGFMVIVVAGALFSHMQRTTKALVHPCRGARECSAHWR